LFCSSVSSNPPHLYERKNDTIDTINDESKQAIRERTPKIEHDFAITAWACSVCPDIVEDAKARLVGNAAARTAIERCVWKLLSNDVDAVADGQIELKHFQNR
jgi:hypothetical protein